MSRCAHVCSVVPLVAWEHYINLYSNQYPRLQAPRLIPGRSSLLLCDAQAGLGLDISRNEPSTFRAKSSTTHLRASRADTRKQCATPNRSGVLKMVSQDRVGEVVHVFSHIRCVLAMRKRYLVLFAFPPHLCKTIRGRKLYVVRPTSSPCRRSVCRRIMAMRQDCLDTAWLPTR